MDGYMKLAIDIALVSMLVYVHVYEIFLTNVFSWTDLEKSVYVTTLLKYLFYLHGCIECWSRMQASVQQALVDCGIFHLLLNEFHTASTTPVSS